MSAQKNFSQYTNLHIALLMMSCNTTKNAGLSLSFIEGMKFYLRRGGLLS